MTSGGLINEHVRDGEAFTCTSAVPHAGMAVKMTSTAGTVDLASGSDNAIGFTLISTVPNPELCTGSTAVAGELVSVFPIREGVVFEVPIGANAVVAIGDIMSLDKTAAGYFATNTDQTTSYGYAMTAADNTGGAAGDKFVKVYGHTVNTI